LKIGVAYLQRMVVALVEFFYPCLIDIETNGRELFGKFNGQWKAYIAQADEAYFRVGGEVGHGIEDGGYANTCLRLLFFFLGV
jgi:hypothetical protein